MQTAMTRIHTKQHRMHSSTIASCISASKPKAAYARVCNASIRPPIACHPKLLMPNTLDQTSSRPSPVPSLETDQSLTAQMHADDMEMGRECHREVISDQIHSYEDFRCGLCSCSCLDARCCMPGRAGSRSLASHITCMQTSLFGS